MTETTVPNIKITLSNEDLRHMMTVLKPVSDPLAVHLQWVVLKCHNGCLRAYRTTRSRLHVVEVPYSGDEGDVIMPILEKVPKNPTDVCITFSEKNITLDYGVTQETIRRPAGESKVNMDAVIPTQTPEFILETNAKYIADFTATVVKSSSFKKSMLSIVHGEKIPKVQLEYYGKTKPFVLRVGDTFAVICPIISRED